MSLYVDIGIGDRLKVGDMTVRLQFTTRKKARFKIDAPKEVKLELEREQEAISDTDNGITARR